MIGPPGRLARFVFLLPLRRHIHASTHVRNISTRRADLIGDSQDDNLFLLKPTEPPISDQSSARDIEDNSFPVRKYQPLSGVSANHATKARHDIANREPSTITCSATPQETFGDSGQNDTLTRFLTKPFHGTVVIEGKTKAKLSAEAFRRGQGDDHIVLWTDSSLRPNAVVAGLAVIEQIGRDKWQRHTSIARRQPKVVRAGFLAIADAMELASTMCEENGRIRAIAIFSDAVPDLRYIDRYHAYGPGRQGKFEMPAKLAKLRWQAHILSTRGVDVVLRYVPAGKGGEGNLRANDAAKQAAVVFAQAEPRKARSKKASFKTDAAQDFGSLNEQSPVAQDQEPRPLKASQNERKAATFAMRAYARLKATEAFQAEPSEQLFKKRKQETKVRKQLLTDLKWEDFTLPPGTDFRNPNAYQRFAIELATEQGRKNFNASLKTTTGQQKAQARPQRATSKDR